jgi:putative ABC transport system permease protein
MFQNYLQVAWRNLVNNKLYSAINIFGLAVGLASCILISLFVRDELSYDKQWANADTLYRLHTTFVVPGREPFVAVVTPGPARQALRHYFAGEIAAATRFNGMWPVITYQGKAFSEQVHWTDPDTADMFDLKVLSGDLKQTLNDNASLAIDASFSRKHFGTTATVGEIVTVSVFDMKRDFRIGAVFEDLPHNTALSFQALAMIDEADWHNQPWLFDHWFSINNQLFFQLEDGASIDSINDRITAFTDQGIDLPPQTVADPDTPQSDFIKLSTISIKDIQLDAVGDGEMKPTGDRTTVSIFAAIAALILFIACVNFMNLATSRSTQRAREVALRKVMGARRGQLVAQFIGESVIIALIGLLVGVVLVELVLPSYSEFLGKELFFSYTDSMSLGILAGLVLVVGLVGGVYPALVLSGFQPARVLKANKSTESSGSAMLRNALVVFQFTISIALIAATATVYGQMLYATSMDPGFNKEGLLAVMGANRSGAAEKQKTLKEQILAIPAVTGVTLSSERPFSSNENNQSVEIPGHPELGSILIGSMSIDYDFLDTLEIPLVAGRNYSPDYSLDAFPDTDADQDTLARSNILINEGALRRFGFGTAQEALGREILVTMGEEKKALFTVVGVIADMHFQSLKSVKRPEMYFMAGSPTSNVLVRHSGDPLEVAAEIERVWRELIPSVPFAYEFSDQVAAEEFTREANVGVMLGSFSALAVIIACLGLFGLASFTAERRTREIGIRKVLGASVMNIVKLLIWQFSKPVLLANLLAWPIAAWGLLRWLENFPYRLDSWILLPLLLIAGMIALAVAWATVGGNAARVANRNPVEALRYE